MMMTMLKCYPQSGQKTLMRSWKKVQRVEKPGVHDDMLDDLVFIEEPSIVDFKQLEELRVTVKTGHHSWIIL
ncbi:hypothetical protein HanRHA438_Chr05g0218181 [Helianthus annuus]|uniref:Uncharacterized protein n=1 Tax=Helianthus annuus TaxID=4232 RepID=A0A9K3NMM8_HELAN|nr:hypothetical protein HanXRQr2_Chr05g0208691 [Helianthus annuus]KAJ0569831.1 hypothetical protein HanHA300_Chr05g0171041 [Helianthus annuus]KAJ0576463.1 hypothetical protein HanIR_Chr05g0224721 [Helianthus annuus]KAJ0584153.1 hypothetical protein HanHA89_Chr05g0185231 [Helianthus annuus]KAJ0749822.1 hypothetical protein HanLR1_Chr05g0174621 [Helianthus annuus]